MKITEYFSSDNKEYWLSEIKKSEWSAGKFLYKLLNEEKFKETVGINSEVLMLTEGEELISFCTLAEKDDIQPTDLTPWVGFVYTFPQHRGHRYSGRLLAYAEEKAKAEGVESIYISTNHKGLYEKFGYEFFGFMKDLDGEDSRVYAKKLKY